MVPTTVDPTSLSDDVSLVQQYDGGAVGIAETTFPPDNSTLGIALEIEQPEVAIRHFLSVVGIATVTDMVRLPSGLYARIFGIQTLLSGGASPTVFFMDMRPPTGSGVPDNIQLITEDLGAVPTSRTPLRLTQNLILPGTQINMQQQGGAVGTQVKITMNWIVAPVGAIIINSNSQSVGA